MRIWLNNAHDGNDIVVRWLKDGEYGQGDGPAFKGVVLPEGAQPIDIALTGRIIGTPQVVFDPTYARWVADKAA